MHDCVHNFSCNLHVISAFLNDVLIKGVNSKILSDLEVNCNMIGIYFLLISHILRELNSTIILLAYLLHNYFNYLFVNTSEFQTPTL